MNTKVVRQRQSADIILFDGFRSEEWSRCIQNHTNIVWGIMHKTDARSKLQTMPLCIHFSCVEEKYVSSNDPTLDDLSVSLPDATQICYWRLCKWALTDTGTHHSTI